MRARILKIGFKYQPEIYTKHWGWVPYSTIYHYWAPTLYPQRFWTKRGAMKLINSMKGFNL